MRRRTEATACLLFAFAVTSGCDGASSDVQKGGKGGSSGGSTGINGGNAGSGGADVGGTSAGTSTGGTSVGGTNVGGTNVGGTSTGGSDIGGEGGNSDNGGTSGSVAGSGGGGSSGMGGAGGKGGAGGAATIGIAELVGALDGRLILTPCQDLPSTDDCNLTFYVDGVQGNCSGNQMNVVIDHPIRGTPGATYLVTMHFYGIVEPKNYGPNLTREAGFTRPSNLNTGAEPPPWAVGQPGVAYMTTTYGTHEIHVLDNNMQVVGVYFLNSDTEEGHYTYVINYERTIPVIGGGFVRLRRYDSNCRIIKNCGATSGFPCAAKARTVDLSRTDPPPPPPGEPSRGGFGQPGLGESNDHSGLWWFIDVTAVRPM